MNKIKYLLKFGKKEHLQSLIAGNLYFSNAVTFWGIENKLNIRGQGDILEASTKLFAQKTTILSQDTNEVIVEFGNSSGLVIVEQAKKMPVFCLFSVYEEDCITDDRGELIINLSEGKKKTIREHFPDADAVVVIPNPDRFIDDVKASIGFDMIADTVQYFYIDKGIITNDGEIAIDMRLMEYITQDTPLLEEKEGVCYRFYSDYAYRVLFCKDVFFTHEQEFRIVLPSEIIDGGTNYLVKLSTKYEIYDLDEFFK